MYWWFVIAPSNCCLAKLYIPKVHYRWMMVVMVEMVEVKIMQRQFQDVGWWLENNEHFSFPRSLCTFFRSVRNHPVKVRWQRQSVWMVRWITNIEGDSSLSVDWVALSRDWSLPWGFCYARGCHPLLRLFPLFIFLHLLVLLFHTIPSADTSTFGYKSVQVLWLCQPAELFPPQDF